MEEYKRLLCNGMAEEELYNYVINDPYYTYNLNEDGLLHSTYDGTHYKPAITYRGRRMTEYMWLFNGRIIDCEHPFKVGVIRGQLTHIWYYSSYKIETNQPVASSYNADGTVELYNSLGDDDSLMIKILDNNSYRFGHVHNSTWLDTSMFTPEWYPLCDEVDLLPNEMELRLKFAD